MNRLRFSHTLIITAIILTMTACTSRRENKTSKTEGTWSYTMGLPSSENNESEVDAITSYITFLPGDNKVLLSAKSVRGYQIPLAIGDYNSQTGNITFPSSNPLHYISWFYAGNLQLDIRFENGNAIVNATDGELKPLFNFGSDACMKKEPDTIEFGDDLVGEIWKSSAEDNEVATLEFINDREVILNHNNETSHLFYILDKGKLAIVTGDNPDKECVTGVVRGNVIELQREGIARSYPEYNITLHKQ